VRRRTRGGLLLTTPHLHQRIARDVINHVLGGRGHEIHCYSPRRSEQHVVGATGERVDEPIKLVLKLLHCLRREKR
jgi:hypothetical protein